MCYTVIILGILHSDKLHHVRGAMGIWDTFYYWFDFFFYITNSSFSLDFHLLFNLILFYLLSE